MVDYSLKNWTIDIAEHINDEIAFFSKQDVSLTNCQK